MSNDDDDEYIKVAGQENTNPKPPVSSTQVLAGIVTFITIAAAAVTTSKGSRSIGADEWPAFPLFCLAMIVGCAFCAWIATRWDALPPWARLIWRPAHELTPALLAVGFAVVGAGMMFVGVIEHFSP